MEIYYNDSTDLLYLRFDPRKQPLRNEDLTADIVLDIGDNDRLVGIEILGASHIVNLESLLPVAFRHGSREEAVPRGAPAAG
jgi:uncharacterized protein YuzE